MSSGRITGLCGRLRCCLAFEHPTYKSFRDRAPRVGRRVETPQGGGVVTAYQVLEDTCTVELRGRRQRRSPASTTAAKWRRGPALTLPGDDPAGASAQT